MAPIHITVAAIIEHNNQFLMVEERDSNGNTVFNQPAGHVELNESLTDAVIREVQEETGLEFSPKNIIGHYLLSPATNGKHYYRTCYTGTVENINDLQPQDSDIIACHWLTIEQIKSLGRQLRSGLVLNCLHDYLRGERYPLSQMHYIDDEVRAAQMCYNQLP
ncbi:MAG: NUDIX hydrolase [Gammaproteobacteria bacterium]|nr:NUDIX hydrolase [Gammaproteobacteria bacterium]